MVGPRKSPFHVPPKQSRWVREIETQSDDRQLFCSRSSRLRRDVRSCFALRVAFFLCHAPILPISARNTKNQTETCIATKNSKTFEGEKSGSLREQIIKSLDALPFWTQKKLKRETVLWFAFQRTAPWITCLRLIFRVLLPFRNWPTFRCHSASQSESAKTSNSRKPSSKAFYLLFTHKTVVADSETFHTHTKQCQLSARLWCRHWEERKRKKAKTQMRKSRSSSFWFLFCFAFRLHLRPRHLQSNGDNGRGDYQFEKRTCQQLEQQFQFSALLSGRYEVISFHWSHLNPKKSTENYSIAFSLPLLASIEGLANEIHTAAISFRLFMHRNERSQAIPFTAIFGIKRRVCSQMACNGKIFWSSKNSFRRCSRLPSRRFEKSFFSLLLSHSIAKRQNPKNTWSPF